MATVKIDIIETLEMKEQWGVLVGVKRQAKVIGLTGTTWETMYDALEAAGLPKYGEYLDDDRGAELALTDREVQMIDRDKAVVDLTYKHFNDAGQNLFPQNLDEMEDRSVAGKMTASVVQKETNLYREGGSGPETLIKVTHTYPDTDADYGGKTITQTGKVQVFIPQRTFTVRGIKSTAAPWNMAEALVGAVNNAIWLGKPKHTWMCTEVTWDYRMRGQFFMEFQFQHNPDTWNPTAIFIDDRTGRPPEGVVPGLGYKYIRYHTEVNFPSKLGFFCIGPGQTKEP